MYLLSILRKLIQRYFLNKLIKNMAINPLWNQKKIRISKVGRSILQRLKTVPLIITAPINPKPRDRARHSPFELAY